MGKDISLVILAAGIGSRFGGGVKQLAPVGPNGEVIIDYSIHDAIKAGFNKIVFIIRKDIYDDFYEVIGERMEKRFKALGVKWEYVFQDKNDIPEGFSYPEGRTKPWGTGHAVLACRDVLNEPFAVINADDYYGKSAYVKAYEFLKNNPDEKSFGLVGYVLKNTLSDNGAVTRGICSIENGKLIGICETHNIVKTENGAVGEFGDVELDSVASMNFWMFPRSYVGSLKEGFPAFLDNMNDPLKDEYLLPVIVDELLEKKSCTVTVETSDDSWFGVTYKEDKDFVVESFKRLYENGEYSLDLYSDF